MLDLFTIFTKGGIVLWYIQGTALSLTPAVNQLIKSVILQVSRPTSINYPLVHVASSFYLSDRSEAGRAPSLLMKI